MPIVRHNIEATVQADGGTSNVLRMYDQDDMEYMEVFYAPVEFDIDAKVLSAIAETDQAMIAKLTQVNEG